METDVESGVATSFTVDPGEQEGTSWVIIATRYRKSGLAGWLERLFAPGFLRRLYLAELALLAKRVEAG